MFLRITHKLIKLFGLVSVFFAIWSGNVFAQEITAINFNGDILGKVIPDGKVVGFENQLIGNVTADSLIVDFDGKLIGGVVPQGIAIGNDAMPIGKVGNDGAVRMSSGQTIGKVLPNGLVINDAYDIVGGVVFPGLVYSDDGKTIGRVTGDGRYANLQGQRIGIITPDGYAYRKAENDYILDGRLISSKMVVSLQGEFIGSVVPGGAVSDFDSNIIGKIKANGYAYNDAGKVIGHVVRTGYGFDENGIYLGVVTFNGEVVDGDNVIGKIRADNKIIDVDNNIIGYGVDIGATATDLKGAYLGRIMPDGKLARNQDAAYFVRARGIIIDSLGTQIGQLNATGPVFDYKGELKGHAISNGSIISLSGTPIGKMVGEKAFDLSGRQLGAVLQNRVVLSSDNKFIGISGINSELIVNNDKFIVTPTGYVFNNDGLLGGSNLGLDFLYSPNGGTIATLGLDGVASDINGGILGALADGGYVLGPQNQLLGKNINDLFVSAENGSFLGNLNAKNLLINSTFDVVAKILPDNSVVEASSDDNVSYMPRIGNAWSGNIATDFRGYFLGYADVLGNINSINGTKIGRITDRGILLDNNGFIQGVLNSYGAVIDDNCSFVGVYTPRGEVQNFRGTYLGRSLGNNFVVGDGGTIIGYKVQTAPVVDFSGKVIGFIKSDGTVTDASNAKLGCVKADGSLKTSDGKILGRKIIYSSAMNFDGDIIGRSVLDGSIVDEKNQIIAYQQPNGNINSVSGLPLGAIFEYKYAFDMNNRFLGLVTSDGLVKDNKGKELGKVDFEGYVQNNNQKIGYALYDLYVYDNDNNVIGVIDNKGYVTDFSNQNIGKIERGFLIDKDDNVIGRGLRDYNIRDNSRLVIGHLQMNGKVVNERMVEIGEINKSGEILNRKNEVIAKAYPLQYYSKISVTLQKQKIYGKDGKLLGDMDEKGNLVDENGDIIGRVDKDGNIIDDSNEVVKTSAQSEKVYDKEGAMIGVVDAKGNVIDANGKIVGKLSDSGNVIDANGNIIGGIGLNWYEKVSPAKKIKTTADDKDVSPALKLLENTSYKRSLGIALTPDGEYLGDIMDDDTVVNKKGKVVGRRMPDGLIVNDKGALIGLEEPKYQNQESSGSIFVPPGSFGDGGAYGTGEGSPGNLGPGGGYGPGERYDPMRQAALNAAMNERRQNISVGKISSGMRKEAFDGMQKDWSEQGINKVISSWRVDLSEMILSDKPIPAVIARAIDSNNPAPITAFVERNVYAEEGRNVIIPAGSRLIGTLGGVSASAEATSEAARVQISWERLIRPDGSLFVFQGLTADAQGRGGALGYVDQQLFKKYTLPVLTTTLTSATSYIMAPDGDASEGETPRQQAANDARENFIDEMNEVFDEILADKSSVKALTYVPAGTRIIVFPNTDLWLRSEERDKEESFNASKKKPEVLINDVQSQQAANDNTGAVSGSQATVSGDVVYDAGENVQPTKKGAVLIDDTAGKKKASNQPYMIPPPPPPSSSSTAISGATPSAASKSENSESIPALF